MTEDELKRREAKLVEEQVQMEKQRKIHDDAIKHGVYCCVGYDDHWSVDGKTRQIGIKWPADLREDELDGLDEWFALVLAKIKRLAKTQQAEMDAAKDYLANGPKVEFPEPTAGRE